MTANEDISGDGGLLKKILQEGEGDAKTRRKKYIFTKISIIIFTSKLVKCIFTSHTSCFLFLHNQSSPYCLLAFFSGRRSVNYFLTLQQKLIIWVKIAGSILICHSCSHSVF
jgi:hypothetical protein